MNKHMEFAEAMRNIMRNKEEEEKKSNPKSADDDLDEKRVLYRKCWRPSLMSFLER